MRVYFSGVGGVGIGPLCEIAHDAGYSVVGSDRQASQMTKQLESRGILVSFDQSGSFLDTEHKKQPFDWFIHTAALPKDHPELLLAKKLGIKTAKRDELLAHIIKDKQLKLIAIAGTHGKTSTTSLLVWAMQQLKQPISYSVGGSINFGPSGLFNPESRYFVYECDEFDRNFLKFKPFLSIITSIDYDHPETYSNREDYQQAFAKFIDQSENVITWQRNVKNLNISPRESVHLLDDNSDTSQLKLVGQHNRENAFLLATAFDLGLLSDTGVSFVDFASTLPSFPGPSRRFEKLADNIYSDYGHHPTEIKATLSMAKKLGKRVILVYQPHQNIRQHQIYQDYTDQVFADADEIYWLPTYFNREDPDLEILQPEQLTAHLSKKVHFADLDDNLWQSIQQHQRQGDLVLCMGAGSIDGWVRQQLANQP